MQKLDKNEQKLVGDRLRIAKELASEIEKTSMPGFEQLIEMLKRDKCIHEAFVVGGTSGEPFTEFAKRTVSFDTEMIFLLEWCVKGFKGIKACSEKYAESINSDILGEKNG